MLIRLLELRGYAEKVGCLSPRTSRMGLFAEKNSVAKGADGSVQRGAGTFDPP